MFKKIKQILKNLIDVITIYFDIITGKTDCTVKRFMERQYLFSKSIDEKLKKLEELNELIELGLDEMCRISEELDYLEPDSEEFKRLDIAFTNLEKELTIVEIWANDISKDIKYLEYKIHHL